MTNFMDELISDINSRGRDKSLEFKIGENERAKVRVLTDGRDMYKGIIHGRFIKNPPDGGNYGYTLPCPLEFGKKECIPHGKDDPYIRDQKNQDKLTTFRTSDTKFSLILFDFRDSKMKLLCQRSTRGGILAGLAEVYENFGSLLGRDITIKRTGKDFQTAYTVQALDPSPFTIKLETPIPEKQAEIWAMMKEMMAKLWMPDLMKPGELTWPSYIANDPDFSGRDLAAANDEENELLPGSEKKAETDDDLL